jgi:hypothetical protein
MGLSSCSCLYIAQYCSTGDTANTASDQPTLLDLRHLLRDHHDEGADSGDLYRPMR